MSWLGSDEMKKICHIIIEGHDADQMQEFFEEIQNKYNLYDNAVFETEVPPENTIIDADRFSETGKIIIDEKLVKKFGEKHG